MEREILSTGLEAIAVQQDRAFGKALEAWVLKAQQEYRRGNSSVIPTTLLEFSAIVKTHTNMTVRLRPLGQTSSTNAGAGYGSLSHLGSSERDFVRYQGFFDERGFEWFTGTGQIDFVKGRVSGGLADIEHQVGLGGGLFREDTYLSLEEVVSIILHELGHCFTSMSTIECLVMTNYYLTEGIDAMLGGESRFATKKVDALKIMGRYVTDPALLGRLADNSATRDDWSKAILLCVTGKRREQFRSVGMGDRRDEQLADLYTFRQGYARAFITGLAADHKYGGWYSKDFDKPGFMVVESLKVVTALGFVMMTSITAPVIIVVSLACLYLGTNNEDMHYDRMYARCMKAKNDLVFQLRQPDLDDEFRKSVISDIKIMDALLKTMHDNRSIFNLLSNFVNPKYRERYQLRAQEETLEALLNNNLFVTALSRK